jgi:hypothetical protein
LPNVLQPFEEEAVPGSEVATIVGTPAWWCDDVMGIAALHPSYGLLDILPLIGSTVVAGPTIRSMDPKFRARAEGVMSS